MVARLKLKGIDGRAPPGVNHTRFSAQKSVGNRWLVWLCKPCDTCQIAGKP